ncbi:hypothetical protein LOTGIDRAFT_170322 [Lottia gigantea]|uniref:CUB domain-containing protein n=1 Tax=Lottia gigantea TaxID=225164 RepID=V3YVN7_LOTGI|nr:hypothetical protein LOTGIDRAFT_170322 [Lottia gigantea]ESO82048.1 hypothetical protein LOTGIDRAFT_170322 [Lottia gigantea]
MEILRLFVFGMFLSMVWNEEEALPRIRQSTVCLNCKKASTVKIACVKHERIGFEGIYYGGKNIRSCKVGAKLDCQISTPNCCIPDKNSDCIATVDTKSYYESCLGLESCSFTFADDSMTCSQDSSITNPNYAGISYYCIPETTFVYLEQDSISNGNVVYLINQDYPVALGSFTAFTCSVETKCGKTLSISALDIFLGYDGTRGQCIHELTIQDNELDFKESIEIICGKNARRRPSPCWVTQEDITISTTMSYNSTNGTNLSKSTMPDDDTPVRTIVLSVIIILLVAVGITIGVSYYKKHKQSKISPNENVVALSTSSNTGSENELSTPSPGRVPTRKRLEDEDDQSDDHNATESPTSDNWRTRSRRFVPPLVDYPSAPIRKSTVLPGIGERRRPRSYRAALPQDIRRPLPKIERNIE